MRFGDESSLADLDALHWRDFERLVAELFERRGYETTCVGGKRDHGADVVAEGHGERLAIQVKHRASRRWVGERTVSDVVGSLPAHRCERGIVVTNSTYAPGTAGFADLHGVELWDGDRLRNELLSFCVLCERRVSDAVREWCLDRPDEFRGCVYCFDHQRRLAGVLRTTRAR